METSLLMDLIWGVFLLFSKGPQSFLQDMLPFPINNIRDAIRLKTYWFVLKCNNSRSHDWWYNCKTLVLASDNPAGISQCCNTQLSRWSLWSPTTSSVNTLFTKIMAVSPISSNENIPIDTNRKELAGFLVILPHRRNMLFNYFLIIIWKSIPLVTIFNLVPTLHLCNKTNIIYTEPILTIYN